VKLVVGHTTTVLPLLSLQELERMFGAGPALSRHGFNTMDQE